MNSNRPDDERQLNHPPYSQMRERMVDDQLSARRITDERVLHAMREVPRELFVAPKYREAAYSDAPLPIGFGQTISQPYSVAFMIEALELNGSERVLDVGTGSGYQAAILSRLAKEVHSVERVSELALQAAETLTNLNYDNVFVHIANGTLGWAEEAPYDAIIVAASSEKLPLPLEEQLAEGGRIIIPLGAGVNEQRLYRFSKRDGVLEREDLGAFRFVPLIGEFGWKEDNRF